MSCFRLVDGHLAPVCAIIYILPHGKIKEPPSQNHLQTTDKQAQTEFRVEINFYSWTESFVKFCESTSTDDNSEADLVIHSWKYLVTCKWLGTICAKITLDETPPILIRTKTVRDRFASHWFKHIPLLYIYHGTYWVIELPNQPTNLRSTKMEWLSKYKLDQYVCLMLNENVFLMLFVFSDRVCLEIVFMNFYSKYR